MPFERLGLVCVRWSVRVGFVYNVSRGGCLCGGVHFVPYVCLGVWCLWVRFALFVTSLFVSYESKGEDLYGEGVCVQYVCLGVGCVQLGVCRDVDVLVVALWGLWDGLYMYRCMIIVLRLWWCLSCEGRWSGMHGEMWMRAMLLCVCDFV